MSNNNDRFKNAISDKHIPILILDSKWHKLFAKTGTTDEIIQLEKKLESMLKKQARLKTQNKELKVIKKNLMDEIVVLMKDIESRTDSKTEKKLNDNKRLINDANSKLEENENELMELPREIDSINRELMMHTMDLCYEKLQNNTEYIEQIADWIKEMRIQLKRNIIKKQEREVNNAELYSYMHDIFGADVLELFDMKYEPTLPQFKSEHNEKTTDKQTNAGN